MNFKNWVAMVLMIIAYYFIYYDNLVFLSAAAAAAVNHTLADERAVAGFISIDCGMVAKSRFDNDSGLYYSSDDTFIDTGRKMDVHIEFNDTYLPIYNTLRSFPEGTRNCYTLKPLQGKNITYLVRARFHYGDYDGLQIIPIFDLFIGVNFWTTVQPSYIGSRFFYELIYAPTEDFIHVCLVNIGSGIPFISALELRPVNNSAYRSSSGALELQDRFDIGAVHAGSNYVSIIDDPYDRLWAAVQPSPTNWVSLHANVSMNSACTNAYEMPPSVLETAAILVHGSSSLDYRLNGTMYGIVQVYWHFSEMQKLEINDTREFTVSMNGNFQSGKISPRYQQLLTIVSPATRLINTPIEFSLKRTRKSTLPPILNAFEMYIVLDLPTSATYQDDVKAISKIKTNYNTVITGWQGDPCLPFVPWDGLNCSNTTSDHPRITSLDLSSKGLRGEILPSLSGLTALNILNMSYNALTGSIPDFLAEMSSLKVIDLRGNKLNGSVPVKLADRIAQGTLSLSLEDNPDLCVSNDSCKKKKKKKKKNWKKIGVIICAAAASIIFIAVAVAIAVFCKYKHRARNIMQTSTEMESRRFKYSEVMDIMGKGGSGIVYHGLLKDGTSVAVKILNPSSKLSLKLFHTEAELLTRVHHRNLVSLIGYCEEGTTLALIYEHVSNGNLQQHISEKNAKVLSWKERLQISIDVALGLEYLHGCKPSIVHRDMKTSNILLDENLRAKISDFGISKAFSTESTESSMTTNIVGTHGYLDPEYYTTQRLNRKSDVFSFGVVLLELITGQPPIIRGSSQPIHVIAWTAPKLESRDIDNIVDKRLRGNFSISSAWKALEIAMVCVSTIGIQRPSMNQVLTELNDSLTIEIEHERTRDMENHSTLNVDDGIAALDTSMEMGPSAR